ncbi:MAG TPA: BtrH N-terminal domain-containing protein [Steroidobacteraceae bacterium]|nr:BtrH N-terminal domain-containing protein [Steroidobacteraceae bacterium]
MTTFQHRQAAHCESGVVSSLVSHYGLPMSEPMAFGLASALAFAYMPFIKMGGMPLISYRMWPGAIVKAMHKRLGITMARKTFRNSNQGMAALDAELDAGRVVGLQTCIYWLPYVPEQFRFHFNVHNIIAYGREGDDYLISDPLFEMTTRCARSALAKARFAKGAMEAKGLMYFPTQSVGSIDYRALLPKVIRANYRNMMQPLFPMIGVKGIRFLARNIVKLAAKEDPSLPLYLTHIVRMQEEIGSGGAGFRFIYASFLQEAARIMDNDALMEASKQLTAAGDEWRRFALQAAKMCRGRAKMDADVLSHILNTCADREAAMWKSLPTFAG